MTSARRDRVRTQREGLMTKHLAPFKYWAFVSYSHHDKRVAKRLVAELAAQPIPASFRDRVEGAPRRFAPVFRDERDVAVAPSLEPALIDALDDSAKLIVICSPFAVASRYVAAEIKHFIARGRASDILCLIASGIPERHRQRPARTGVSPAATARAQEPDGRSPFGAPFGTAARRGAGRRKQARMDRCGGAGCIRTARHLTDRIAAAATARSAEAQRRCGSGRARACSASIESWGFSWVGEWESLS